jgi:hypothetical protein
LNLLIEHIAWLTSVAKPPTSPRMMYVRVRSSYEKVWNPLALDFQV